MKLAITQMVFGMLIALILSPNLWRYPPLGDPVCFVWAVVINYFILIVPFFLGLAVLGCGIAQYLKARG